MPVRICLTRGCNVRVLNASYCVEHAPKRRSPSSKRTGTARYQRAKRAALRRARGRCEHCGSTDAVEVHHRVPVEDGGTDRLTNLVVLCAPHHRAVTHGRLTL